MSDKYNEAMDKIVASDELKEKIKKAASEKIINDKKSKKFIKYRYIRYAAGAAACIAICLTGINVSKEYYVMPTPTQSASPLVTETPDNTELNLPGETTGNGREEAKNAANQQTPAPNKTKIENTTPSAPQKTEIPKSRITDTVPTLSPQAPDKTAEPTVSEIPPQSAVPSIQPEDNEPIDNDENTVMGGNPFSDEMSLDEINAELGYEIKTPSYLPNGFEKSSMLLIGDELVQISYSDDKDSAITYRTQKTDEDISGDYNVYDICETEIIGNTTATLKGSDKKYYTAVWNDGENAYALGSDDGLEKNEIIKIIKSIN